MDPDTVVAPPVASPPPVTADPPVTSADPPVGDIANFDMAKAVDRLGAGLFNSPGDSSVVPPVTKQADPAQVDPNAPVVPATVEAKPGDPPAPVTGAPVRTPAPKTWNATEIAEWDKLSPVAQAAVIRREEDFHKGIESYKAGADVGRRITEVLTPYLPTLRQANLDPMETVKGTLQAHWMLATGTPEQKLATLIKVAQDYGIPLDGVAQHVEREPYSDPQVADLTRQVNELKSQITGSTQAEQQKVVDAARVEFNTFAADPKNKFLPVVGGDMLALIQSGRAKNYAQAYEMAVWANPETRVLEQTRLSEEEAAKRVAAEADRVAKAKSAAGANVFSSAKDGNPTKPTGTMDDTLKDTYAAIAARG